MHVRILFDVASLRLRSLSQLDSSTEAIHSAAVKECHSTHGNILVTTGSGSGSSSDSIVVLTPIFGLLLSCMDEEESTLTPSVLHQAMTRFLERLARSMYLTQSFSLQAMRACEESSRGIAI